MDWQVVTYGPCGARAPVTACAYCGRNNDPSAQFCMDCGKPMGKSGRLRADRKSTRLNSSHVRISYAVFCLKKKKHRCIPARRSVPPLDPSELSLWRG